MAAMKHRFRVRAAGRVVPAPAQAPKPAPDEPVFPAAISQLLREDPWRDVSITADLIGVRGFNCLRRAGFSVLAHLAGITQQEFLAIRGAGVTSLALLQERVTDLVTRPIPDARDAGVANPAVRQGLVAGTPIFDADTAAVLKSEPWSDELITEEVVGSRAANRLRREGYLVFANIADLSEERFLSFYAVGKTALELLRSGILKALAGPPPIRSDRHARVADLMRAEQQTAEDPAVVAHTPIGEWLDLPADAQTMLDPWLDQILLSDPQLGLRSTEHVSIREVLGETIDQRRGLVGYRDQLRTGLLLIADRLEHPQRLSDELSALVPANRSGEILCRRWGWDGDGRKTLDEVAQEYKLTRERIRQIVDKVERKQLERGRFLPTACLIQALLQQAGGAMRRRDLAVECRQMGLTNREVELEALEEIGRLKLVRDWSVVESEDGDVLGVSKEAIAAIQTNDGALRGAVRRQLRRRGFVSLAEVQAELDLIGVVVDPEGVREHIAGLDGIGWLAGGCWAWRPRDLETPFVKRVAKLLLVVGPQGLHSINRALRRDARRRADHGVSLPMAVLEEALAQSPFVRDTGSRYAWIGPDMDVQPGVAERVVLEVLRARGPVVHYHVIRRQVLAAGIEVVTMSVALGQSLVVERVGASLYAIPGASFTTADLDAARAADAGRGGPAPAVVSGVDRDPAGRVRLTVDVRDALDWNGFLRVPADAGLDGSWTLQDGDVSWMVVVAATQLRNGVKPWFRRQGDAGPTFTLTFDPATRRITPRWGTTLGRVLGDSQDG